jgi:hypothetical protein
MKKSIATEQTPDNIVRVLALLAATPERLAALRADRDEAALQRPFGPGERSFAGVLAHLINTEARSHEAIVLALVSREPLLAKIHPERDYGRLLRHELMPFDESLAYFRYRRAVLLRVLQSLTGSQWSRVVREEGKQRRESVYWLARGMALHEAEHLAEIAAGLGG